MTIGTCSWIKSETAVVEVHVARSRAEFDEIVRIRKAVFRDEQHIVGREVVDHDDGTSVHVYGRIADRVIAIGRLTPPTAARSEGQITWVATLPEHRGAGAGSAVMRALLDIADEHQFPSVLISAQAHAVPFYRRLGFEPYGDRFYVRGIQHQYMERLHPAR